MSTPNNSTRRTPKFVREAPVYTPGKRCPENFTTETSVYKKIPLLVETQFMGQVIGAEGRYFKSITHHSKCQYIWFEKSDTPEGSFIEIWGADQTKVDEAAMRMNYRMKLVNGTLKGDEDLFVLADQYAAEMSIFPDQKARVLARPRLIPEKRHPANAGITPKPRKPAAHAPKKGNAAVSQGKGPAKVAAPKAEEATASNDAEVVENNAGPQIASESPEEKPKKSKSTPRRGDSDFDEATAAKIKEKRKEKSKAKKINAILKANAPQKAIANWADLVDDEAAATSRPTPPVSAEEAKVSTNESSPELANVVLVV